MRIGFKQNGEEHVDIIGIADNGERKNIGHISTPSGSGGNNMNAIQICGFEEAFDLWGCGIFGEETVTRTPITKEQKKIMEDAIVSHPHTTKFYEDRLKKGYVETKKVTMKKDIQLLFKMYDKSKKINMNDDCYGCYNSPCNCERKEGNRLFNRKSINPFTAKRQDDLKDRIELKNKALEDE